MGRRNRNKKGDVTCHFEPRQVSDLRTGKPVMMICEVAGLKMFTGFDNKKITKKEMAKGAAEIVKRCEARGIRPTGVACALITLGYMVLEKSARRM